MGCRGARSRERSSALAAAQLCTAAPRPACSQPRGTGSGGGGGATHRRSRRARPGRRAPPAAPPRSPRGGSAPGQHDAAPGRAAVEMAGYTIDSSEGRCTTVASVLPWLPWHTSCCCSAAAAAATMVCALQAIHQASQPRGGPPGSPPPTCSSHARWCSEDARCTAPSGSGAQATESSSGASME